MASIKERGGRFQIRVRRDGFETVAKTFIKRSDALAWGRRVEADMESGRWTDAKTATPTLREAVAQYQASALLTLKGHKTYGYWLEEIAATGMASKAVNAITPHDLASWRDAQQLAGLKPGTVVRKLGLLSGVLNWCHKERGWISSNPMRSVSKPRVSDARERTLSASEFQYLQAAAQTSRAPWLADAIVVLLRTAMRRGELWGLRTKGIDFEKSVAHLADTKNGVARNVPLCPVSREALRRLADAAQRRGDEGVIPVGNAAAISLAYRRTLVRARRAYVEDCSARGVCADHQFLEDACLHDLRHHAITLWASTGGLSLMELMAVSGHKTPRMLARYTHLKASTLAEKLATLAGEPSANADAGLAGIQHLGHFNHLKQLA